MCLRLHTQAHASNMHDIGFPLNEFFEYVGPYMPGLLKCLQFAGTSSIGFWESGVVAVVLSIWVCFWDVAALQAS